MFLFLFISPTLHSAYPPKPSSYITDQAGVIDPGMRVQMESLLVELKSKTGAEVAVVTVASLDGEQVEEYAVGLFELWGIGEKGKDNGILFLIAPNDRKVRIEVGYGLEGVVPDATASQILNQQVLPAFGQGQISAGIGAGTAMLAKMIADEANVTLRGKAYQSVRRGPKREASFLQKVFSFLFFIIMVMLVIRHPWLLLFFLTSGRGGGFHGGRGGFGGGSFGGFGGGLSGGGGASGSW